MSTTYDHDKIIEKRPNIWQRCVHMIRNLPSPMKKSPRKRNTTVKADLKDKPHFDARSREPAHSSENDSVASTNSGSNKNRALALDAMLRGRIPSTIKVRSWEELNISFDQIAIGSTIAYRGDLPLIYKCEWRGQAACLKLFETWSSIHELTEMCLMSHLESEFIVRCYGYSSRILKGDAQLFSVMEYMECGNLRQALRRGLSVKEKLQACFDAARAIQYIHNHAIIHRDVKTDNFLVTRSPKFLVKLADFGMARGDDDEGIVLGNESVRRIRSICGTDNFMANEMILNTPYSNAVDVFGFGVTLMEILTERVPGEEGFLERVPMTNFEFDLSEFKRACKDDMPVSLFALACQCVSYESADRPTISECVDWLSDLSREYEAGDCELMARHDGEM